MFLFAPKPPMVSSGLIKMQTMGEENVEPPRRSDVEPTMETSSGKSASINMEALCVICAPLVESEPESPPTSVSRKDTKKKTEELPSEEDEFEQKSNKDSGGLDDEEPSPSRKSAGRGRKKGKGKKKNAENVDPRQKKEIATGQDGEPRQRVS
ncbi:unnamed protein product [Nesidiocoris tenuis]|uniref:Uncharacterized protein n=1 Tax=Nesidiocoris tenuis TaxID=355587 RepID=A0A6H5H346_9HEMI|nr:unnamed protein product [Nesidiocoris tenuis]